MLSGKEIRQKFIHFFEDKGHTHVKSSSLVPFNDPTLLFTNAGMNQFKDVFLGLDALPYERAVTAQKCVRAGGKHNDLETVGKTARHHTFFEMLGNFSFGDYFKKDAIIYAWDFLTKELGLDPETLYITVYTDDDEAHQLWQDHTGFPDEKILRLGDEENFWQMGDVGPCGPCSEIHYDRGEAYACDHPDGCKLGVCDCDRWLEIWNLVFMQFNRDASGRLTPLPNPNIDTGMGLERITSVLQKVDTNYETDLMMPLIRYAESLSGKTYDPGVAGFPFRVIADHARACTFLIADGVMPSNEGRGYVLRRILRRAIRLGRTLGLTEPFLHRFPAQVIKIMGEDYPEIVEQQQYIEEIIQQEEKRFLTTLQDGLKIVQQTVDALKAKGESVIPGEAAFLFYDTYGFPIDLTKDIADENDLTVDVAGFEDAMAEQRRKSKDARRQVDVWDVAKQVTNAYPELVATRFIGYDDLQGQTTVMGIMADGHGQTSGYDISASLLVDETPFYAQGGGQVGDSGKFIGENGVFIVENTVKLPNGIYVHEGYVDGRIDVGDRMDAQVDQTRRQAVARNHTATHLLHYALQTVLGDQVHQSGSLVDEGHLRFDFTFPQAVNQDALRQVEEQINAMVLTNAPVQIFETDIENAKASGHIALFGEKYGTQVRCVDAGPDSKELCGGTHVNQLGEIGLFKIVSEGAVSAGIRRIEAITGPVAYQFMNQKSDLLHAVAQAVKATKDTEILEKIEQQDQTIRELRKEVRALKTNRMQDDFASNLANVVEVGEVRVLALQVTADSADELRSIADRYRDQMKEALIVLGAVKENGDVMLVSMLTPDAVRDKLHAGKVIKEVAALVDGKGGGRPDIAQAGGKNASALPAALQQVSMIAQSQMK